MRRSSASARNVSVLAAGDGGGSIAKVVPLAVLAAAGTPSSSVRCRCAPRASYFIMVTLAFAQMAYFVFHDTKLAGGSDGLFLYAKPSLGALNLDDKQTMYYVVIATLVGTYALLALLIRSRFGTRWPASVSTNSACARPGSRPSATSSRPS